MLLDISGNSFSSLVNPQDIDVQRFISAATITSSTEIQAIDTLVFNLKQNNLWDKMQVIYPVVGGTADSHKYNLKDPRDVNAAFRLAFSGTWVHSSTGMKPQTQNIANRANSFYNPASASSLNNAHLSVYVRDIANGLTVVVGAFDGANWFQVNASSGASASNTALNSSVAIPSTTLGNTVGLMLGSRTASNFTGFYVNGVLSGSSAGASTVRPNLNVFYGVRNDIGSFNYPSNQEIAFSSIGFGLTASDAANLNRIVEAYQTTLGRQVVQATTSPVRPPQFILPTVTYNPKQIYGNDLYLWVDLTDWRTMYNSITGNTNIPSVGCVPATSATEPSNHTTVRRIEDLAGNYTGSNLSRKFYGYTSTGPVGPGATNFVPENQITGTTNLFANNVLDSNKGFFSAGAAFNFVHAPDFRNPRDFLAPNSAITMCSYFPQSLNGSVFGSSFGLALDYYINRSFGFFNIGGTSDVALAIPTGGSVNTPTYVYRSNSPNFMANTFGRTIMLTTVICGSTWSIYLNTTLFSSGTLPSSVRYPWSASTLSSGGIIFTGVQGPSNVLNAANSTRTIWEGFIANAYTSPQQINLLYDYFRVKFKDRTYDLF